MWQNTMSLSPNRPFSPLFIFFFFFPWVNFLCQGNHVKKKDSEHLLLRGKEEQVQVTCTLGWWFVSAENWNCEIFMHCIFSCVQCDWDGHHSSWDYLSRSHTLMHQEWIIYLIICICLCSHPVLHIEKDKQQTWSIFSPIYTFKY